MIAKITIIQLAYCMGLKKILLVLDDHTLTDGTRIAVFIRQREAVEINT